MEANLMIRMLFKFAFVFMIVLQVGVASRDGFFFSSEERDNIKYWADQLGDELWQLGQSVTKATEMKARYKKLNVQVREKDGEALLMEIVHNVQRMLDRKRDAVRCIVNAAEDAAEFFNGTDALHNYTFYSAKNSYVVGDVTDGKDDDAYKPMELDPNKNFYSIPVNLNYSSVHVPTNVFDRDGPVLDAIKWSESLDDVFVQNYFSDPGLSFQYFGSSIGLMRSYPAMKWKQEADLFDCRNKFWYTEAATCSKDVVILIDNSGSMTGYRNTIAKLTVSNILDTLNNNDFVAVYNYSGRAEEVVSCFKDRLVQATLENVSTLKAALEDVMPEGYANLTNAFTKAFKVLEKYRELRGCSNSSAGSQCNQAIMLVTDGVTGNHTEVFNTWNREANSTHIPVRVFTFLIGREVTKVREIQWMACLNRGYYVHIHSMNEVREQVFKYIPVIARPLVLQGTMHPVTWTPAYADTADPTLAAWLWDVMDTGRRKKQSEFAGSKDRYLSHGRKDYIYIKDSNQVVGNKNVKLQEYRIIVSVAIPAFNRMLNIDVTNETLLADLLGVAATDIPIKDIEKLTYKYKSGVNGYAFIVTNNGYILLHPDLRPVFDGVLKENYNSVDLTEVEFLDDSNGPRMLNPEIEELRKAMVNYSEGKMLKKRMKFHYDNIRRVAVEQKNFYFAPLKGTPFTLGLSLPDKYGMYYIKAGDEVQKSRHKKIPIIKYLQGGSWRIHPDWTYCKYHHQTHAFELPEDEMRHFLEKMRSPDWLWAEQYEDTEDEDEEVMLMMDNGTEAVNCNRRLKAEDEYYCDRELVQLFTFDAKVTDPFFREDELTYFEQEFVNLYNVSLKFVSTQSGLTRWLRFQERTELDEGDSDFGDLHKKSIEEPYYRSAVLQHGNNPDSYVFSVPFDAGLRDNAVVMASHAIFPRDGGMEAAASVVGLQFQHSALFSRFMSITSKTMCPSCRDCASEELDCFVIDDSGYVVLAEDKNLTGRFFGEVEGAIMDSLRTSSAVFKEVPIFDYQAICVDEEIEISNDANFILTPFNQLKLLVHWMYGQLLWLLFESNLSHIWYGIQSSARPIFEESFESYEIDINETDEVIDEDEDAGQRKTEEIFEVPRLCDNKRNLYVLQYENLKKYEYTYDQCSRPHIVQYIPHTNLVFVVIKSTFETCYKMVSSSSEEILYNGTDHPCQKVFLNDLPRRRISGCFSEHPLEHDVKLCGGCHSLRARALLFVVSWCVVYLGCIQYH
ncbi:Voltage-dependent calcium channel subunit alpha-2/delta-3 [Zootermopsis nevadensis]|uniref:Voltage-dependent calcium channel subunit alpha-2/delta-3 n=1 Tax=Zootermopsis nevadensis TaxID=136037 RepID=A0A067RQW2_ZOONE|nr:Voltage-dependent calcium channel subunit alpha-2/delta-3 [Zootermopsis nevadensis]